MQRLVPRSVPATLALVAVAASAASIGTLGVLATRRGTHDVVVPPRPDVRPIVWTRHAEASFSLEAPRGWTVRRDAHGRITATGGSSARIVLWPVFVGAQLDGQAAGVVARELAAQVDPDAGWTERAGGEGVARLAGGTADRAALSLFTYASGARGTAGYVFVASAPRGSFDRSAPTFARIAASFEARGERVAAAEQPRYERWTDPAEGAFSVEIPAGWKASGGAQRPSPLLVQSSVEATSPDGEVAAAMTDALPVYVEPNPVLEYAGITEGGTYTDPSGYSSPVRTYAPGAEYLRDYLLPTRAGATLTRIEDRPELAARLASHGINSYDAGEVEYTFERDGVPYTGGAIGITERVDSGGSTSWHVWQLYLTEAPTARYGEGVSALGRLAGSFAIDEAWAERQSQTTAAQSRIVSEMSNDVRETLSSGYWEKQRVHDALSERREKARLEVEDVQDSDGTTYRVESGSSYYWIDPSGTVVGTETSTQPDVDFRALVRLDG